MFRNQKIFLLNSQEEGKLPENLEDGEIAVNNNAGHEFICMKNTDNQMVKFTPNGGGNDNVFERQKENYGISSKIYPYSRCINENSISYGVSSINLGDTCFSFNNMQMNNVSIEKIDENKIKTSINDYENFIELFQECYLRKNDENKITKIKNVTKGEDNKLIFEVNDISKFDFSKKYTCYIKNIWSSSFNSINFGCNTIDDNLSITHGLLNIDKNINNEKKFGFNSIFGHVNILKGEKNFSNYIFGKRNKLLGNTNCYNYIFGEDNTINNNNQYFSFIFGENNILQENKNDKKIKFIVGKNLESKSKYYEFNFGEFNSSNENNILSIGNGINDSKRHNAFSINNLGEILVQEDIATEANGNIEYPNMISIQSLIQRIKDLEAKYEDLKRKYDDIHL